MTFATLRHIFTPLLCSLAFLSASSLAAQDKFEPDAKTINQHGSGIKFNNSATTNPALSQRNRAQGLHVFSMAGSTNLSDNGSAPAASKQRPGQR